MTEKSNLIRRIGKGIGIGITTIILGTGIGAGLYLNSNATSRYWDSNNFYEIEIPATKCIDHILNPNKKVEARYKVNVPTCKGKDISPIIDKYEKKLGPVYFNPYAWADKTGEIYVNGMDEDIQNDEPVLINPRSEKEVSEFVRNVVDFSIDLSLIERK